MYLNEQTYNSFQEYKKYLMLIEKRNLTKEEVGFLLEWDKDFVIENIEFNKDLNCYVNCKQISSF